MHPHQLHALTALADCAAAIPALHAQATASRREAVDGLRSSTYGTRYSSGGYGDGVLDAILRSGDDRTRWRQHLDQVRDDLHQACWLIRSAIPHLPRAAPVSYVAAGIRAAAPSTYPGLARDVNGWLSGAARRAWRALALPPPRQPLPGTPCGRCDTRLLEVCRTAPDPADWTVTCQTCRHITLWTDLAGIPASTELETAA